jgi:hypothetical protein
MTAKVGAGRSSTGGGYRAGPSAAGIESIPGGWRRTLAAVPEFVKRRAVPVPGSIPEALDMFRSEVRFYREIAPAVGLRVPGCYRAEISADGTLLVLEDLSSWQPGADPVAAAQVLAAMHARWAGQALTRWPWLRQVGAAVDLVEELYDQTWPQLAARRDLTPAVRDLASRLVGAVAASERATEGAGQLTLTHGDASLANMRTSPAAEIVLLDWEDVSASPGIVDLAWLLVTSVAPDGWPDVIASYGTSAGLTTVLPAVAVQGLLSLSDTPDGSAAAAEWIARLEAVTRYLTA